MDQFLWGALTASCWMGGMLVFRFWKLTHELFFVFSALGFWVLSLAWFGLSLSDSTSIAHQRVRLAGLVGLALLLVALVDKTWRAR